MKPLKKVILKANVGVLITGRMKSSRLPKKALKKIGKIHSIELVFIKL